jgi:hypothetical protein
MEILGRKESVGDREEEFGGRGEEEDIIRVARMDNL